MSNLVLNHQDAAIFAEDVLVGVSTGLGNIANLAGCYMELCEKIDKMNALIKEHNIPLK